MVKFFPDRNERKNVPQPTSQVGEVFFVPDPVTQFFLLCLLWSTFICFKIDPRNWGLFSVQSLNLLIVYPIAAKILRENATLSPNCQAFISEFSGYTIPVFLQNILNCVPTLQRFRTLPVTQWDVQFTVDPDSALYNWAIGIFNTFNAVQYFNILRQWENSSIYKGAHTKMSLIGNCNDVFGITTTFVTGVDAQRPFQLTPLRIDNNTGSTSWDEPTALPAIFVDGGWNVEWYDGVTMTIQLFFVSFFLGTRVPLIRFIFNSIGKTTINVSASGLASEEQVLLMERFSRFPNPKVVQPGESESDESETPTDEQSKFRSALVVLQRKSGNPNTSSKRFSLVLKKIRKSESAKVSGVDVKITLKGQKLDDETRVKLTTLISNISIQAERASNKIQVDSSQLLNEVSRAWKFAEDIIDPDYGEIK